MWVLCSVIGCNRILIDLIQRRPETILPSSRHQLADDQADERDGLIRIASYIFLVINNSNQTWRLHMGLSHLYRQGNTGRVCDSGTVCRIITHRSYKSAYLSSENVNYIRCAVATFPHSKLWILWYVIRQHPQVFSEQCYWYLAASVASNLS